MQKMKGMNGDGLSASAKIPSKDSKHLEEEKKRWADVWRHP
jgi:hypothetical protein